MTYTYTIERTATEFGSLREAASRGLELYDEFEVVEWTTAGRDVMHALQQACAPTADDPEVQRLIRDLAQACRTAPDQPKRLSAKYCYRPCPAEHVSVSSLWYCTRHHQIAHGYLFEPAEHPPLDSQQVPERETVPCTWVQLFIPKRACEMKPRTPAPDTDYFPPPCSDPDDTVFRSSRSADEYM